MTARLAMRRPRTADAALVAAACGIVAALTVLRPSLAMTAVLGCLGIAVLVVRPDAVTPVVILLIYLNIPAVLVNDHGVPRTIGALVPLLLLVPLAYHLSRRERLLFTPTFLLLLAYFGVQLVSTFVSTHPEVASQKLLTVGLEGIVSYFLVTNVVRTPAELRRALEAIVAAGSLLASVTILQSLTHTYWRSYGGFSLVDPSYYYGHAGSPRAAGPIGDPNYYGQILLVPLALALLIRQGERSRRTRLAAGAAAALIAIAIVLTSSRGTAVAFLTVFTIMVCLRYVSGRQLLAIAAGLAVLVLAFPSYRNHVATVTKLGGATAAPGSANAADVSIQGRAAEMRTATLVFAAHPLVGVGPNVFPLYYQQYAAAIGSDLHATVRYGSQRGEPDARASHDMFLSVAAELGVVGLVAFVAIIAETLWTLAQARRRWLRARPDLAALATGLLLAVVGYVIAGLFLTLAYERYFWLVIALSGAAGTAAVRFDTAAEDAPA